MNNRLQDYRCTLVYTCVVRAYVVPSCVYMCVHTYMYMYMYTHTHNLCTSPIPTVTPIVTRETFVPHVTTQHTTPTTVYKLLDLGGTNDFFEERNKSRPLSRRL